jgi:hypothetical protein
MPYIHIDKFSCFQRNSRKFHLLRFGAGCWSSRQLIFCLLFCKKSPDPVIGLVVPLVADLFHPANAVGGRSDTIECRSLPFRAVIGRSLFWWTGCPHLVNELRAGSLLVSTHAVA